MLVTRTFTLILYVWALIYLTGGAIGSLSFILEQDLVPLVFGVVSLLHAVPVIGTIILISRPSMRTRTLSTVCLISALALFLLSFTDVILNDGFMNQVWRLMLALIFAYNVIQWTKSTNTQLN